MHCASNSKQTGMDGEEEDNKKETSKWSDAFDVGCRLPVEYILNGFPFDPTPLCFHVFSVPCFMQTNKKCMNRRWKFRQHTHTQIQSWLLIHHFLPLPTPSHFVELQMLAMDAFKERRTYTLLKRMLKSSSMSRV